MTDPVKNIAQAAAGVPTKWVSGQYYPVGGVESVYSPVNYQMYRRKIAGAGTTDPSLDITNWGLANNSGSRPPKTIVNGMSAGGANITIMANTAQVNATGLQILSGALTAATYKELVAVTGAGSVKWAAVRCVDATARTLGLKVVIDGVTVFDAVSNSIAATNSGMVAVGSKNGSYNGTDGHAPFNTSLSIQVKSSLTETDKVSLDVSYFTE